MAVSSVDLDVLKEFAGSDAGRAIAAKQAADVQTKRAAAVAAIAELNSRIEREVPAHDAEIHKRAEAVKRARADLLVAEQSHAAAVTSKWVAADARDRAIAAQRLVLEQTAPPEIREFIEALAGAFQAARGRFEVVELPGKRNPITGIANSRYVTNGGDVGALIGAINAARQTATELIYSAEPRERILARLEELRKSLPRVAAPAREG